jgi:hypothetical protein
MSNILSRVIFPALINFKIGILNQYAGSHKTTILLACFRRHEFYRYNKMKTFIFFMIFCPILVAGQQKDLTDSTEFRFGLPVSNDDTVSRVRTDEDPANQWVAVKGSEIPKKLRRTLERNEIYEGWERGELLYDKRIDRYLLRMREKNSVRTYGLAADGSPVSFAEENVAEEDSVD